MKTHMKFSGHVWMLANSMIRRLCEGVWFSSRDNRKWLIICTRLDRNILNGQK